MNDEHSFHKTQVGKNILQMLMFSLYPDEKTIYREYLQNACDSINEALSLKLLPSPEFGCVSIHIDSPNKCIIIEDNGTGIKNSEAEARLKDIAKTSKIDNTNQAGFYGIGRLVGAGYCERLTFMTSSINEEIGSQLSFDVNKLRSIIQDKNNDLEAGEVIDIVTEFTTFIEDKERHYFKVKLEKVLPRYSVLLDEEEVASYLSQVAPIPYSPEFTNNLMIPSIKDSEEKFKTYYEKLNKFRVSTDNYYDLTKLYSLNIDGTGDEIKVLRLFTLTDPIEGDLAWGWYAITQFSKAIPKTDPNTHQIVKTRGIRLRSHNIQIGGEDFFGGTEYFQQPRGNKYFNGEINIIHPEITPTADRSDLAPTDLALKLKDLIKDFFNNEMQKCYEEANKIKNNIKHNFEASQKIEQIQSTSNIDNTQSTDNNIELQKLKRDKEKQEEQLEKSLSTKSHDSEGIKLVKKVYNDLLDKQKNVLSSNTSIKTEPTTNPLNIKNENVNKPKVIDIITEKIELLENNKGTDIADIVKKILTIIDKYQGQVQPKILTSMKNVILDSLIRESI
ncbi:MAG: ATP-binding protein [Victivallales bacterium]|nr:ATP-binding protein [Victivallales bacterium]